MLLSVVCGKAAELSAAYGHRLVGSTVFTQVVGKWNGGMAESSKFSRMQPRRNSIPG